MSIQKFLRLRCIFFQFILWSIFRKLIITLPIQNLLRCLFKDTWIWLWRLNIESQILIRLLMGINEPIYGGLIIVLKSFWRASFVVNRRLWMNILSWWIVLLCNIKHEVNLVLKVGANRLVAFIVEINLNKPISLWLRSMN